MELRDLIQSRSIKCAAHQPGILAETEKIALAQVLDPNQSFFDVMKVDFRHGNSILRQKFSDAHVMAVFGTLETVFHQNERLLRRATNAVEPAIGPPLLDRRDFNFSFAKGR